MSDEALSIESYDGGIETVDLRQKPDWSRKKELGVWWSDMEEFE